MTEATANAPFPLLAYLDGLVEGMRTNLPTALNEWDPKAIHQTRVASRRMKAALVLMEWVLRKRSRKSFGKVMANLRHRLGPLRDLDVMMGYLIPSPIEAGLDSALAKAWLTERLIEERDKIRERSAKKKSAADLIEKLNRWTPVREEIELAGEAVHSLLSESLHLQLDTFAEQAERLSLDGDAHALRIASKNLRYTLEMAGVAGHPLPESMMDTFKEMQDHLGEWHDSVVLTEFSMKQVIRTGIVHRDATLSGAIFKELRELMMLAHVRLLEFGELWKVEGPAIADAIRTMFPLTRPANLTESQTDPDPSGLIPPADPGASPPASASDA